MALFLRTTDKDGKSYGGFQWPLKIGATVAAPDWNPSTECGNGLHGLLDGLGDGARLSWDEDALWWIVEADDAIDLDGKHKFKTCRVIAFGSRGDVTAHLYSLRPGPIHGISLTGGDRATLTGGYGATLTGGAEATLTGGYRATLTGGYMATLTGGYGATLTGGYRATLTGGAEATLTGGAEATLTGGYMATLTGGYGATLTGGAEATLTGGYRATLIFLRWINGRRRALVAYVGEDGIKPGQPYRASDDHKSVVPA